MSHALHFPSTEIGVPAYHHTYEVWSIDHTVKGVTSSAAPITKNYIVPVLEPVAVHTGRRHESYSIIFFGNLNYSLEEYAFGILSNDTFIDLVFWNSSVEGQPVINVTSITVPTDISLTTLLPDNAPFEFPYFQEHVYRITAALDGEPNIQDSLVVTYDTQDTASFPVTGLRTVVFDYAPDWSNGMVQTYTWSTDVLKSKDGTEQRIKQRAQPRMLVEYSLLVKGQESRSLNNLLVSWGDKIFVIPLWMDCCKTLDTSLTGQRVINLQDSTGTAASYSDLFYIPATGLIYTAESLAVSQSPESVVIVDTFPQQINLDDTRTYTIPDVNTITLTIEGTVDAATNILISTPDIQQVALLNNQTLTTATEYVIKGNTVSINVNTGGALPPTDFDINIKDNAEIVSITTGSDLTLELPADTVIYPCVLGFISSIDEYESHTDDLKGLSMQFNSVVLEGFPELITIDQYKNNLVDNTSPHWNQGHKQDIESNLFVTDYNAGVVTSGVTNDFLGTKLERNDVFFDSRNIKQFKQELQRRSGKLRSMWLPSYTTDMLVVNNYSQIDDFLIVEEGKNSLLFNRSDDYKHIRIAMKDGTVYYREILGVVVNGSTETVTIDTALGVTYLASDFKTLSFMSLVRASRDSVTMTWSHTKLVTVAQVFNGVTI